MTKMTAELGSFKHSPDSIFKSYPNIPSGFPFFSSMKLRADSSTTPVKDFMMSFFPPDKFSPDSYRNITPEGYKPFGTDEKGSHTFLI